MNENHKILVNNTIISKFKKTRCQCPLIKCDASKKGKLQNHENAISQGLGWSTKRFYLQTHKGELYLTLEHDLGCIGYEIFQNDARHIKARPRRMHAFKKALGGFNGYMKLQPWLFLLPLKTGAAAIKCNVMCVVGGQLLRVSCTQHPTVIARPAFKGRAGSPFPESTIYSTSLSLLQSAFPESRKGPFYLS